jgi:hypothetical protein
MEGRGQVIQVWKQQQESANSRPRECETELACFFDRVQGASVVAPCSKPKTFPTPSLTRKL